ncbi:cellulose synthase subunit BcsC-related outer membrane protein [Pseudoalteromonas atlantica]|uniref:cellulose synthase subunit BcsC-related outer membrane protein n=1 Tax=Pseudoalteromonas atlantica TaxID=288 RepID=UPI0037369AF2
MSLKGLLGVSLLSSFYFASSPVLAQSPKDLDTQSVNWLVSQIELGEIQQNTLLMTDSLDKLMSVAPGNILAKCAQARVYLALNEPSKAQIVMDQFTALDNTQYCVKQLRVFIKVSTEDKQQIQKARLLAKAGQYPQAVKIYDKLFSPIYPNSEFEYEHISWLAVDSNNWQQALKGFQSLRKRYPDIGRYDIAYARHLLKRDPQNKEAFNIYTHYAHSNQYSVAAEFAWLDALRNLPINKTTELAYRDYLSHYPTSSKGKLQFSDFKTDLKNELIKQADPAYKLWVKGASALEKKQYVKAENLLLRAYKGRPNDHEVLNSLGLLNLRQGRNEKAYKYFKEAQRSTLEVDLVSVYRNLAKTAKFWQYIEQTQLAIAAQQFKRAQLKLNLADTLAESPDTVNYYRAEVFKAQGNYQQAMNYYNKVLANDPINSSSLRGMLEILSVDNNFDRINQFYYQLSREQQQAIIEDYTVLQSQQLRQRATSLVEQGQLDDAVELLLVAIKQTPRESWLYYDLANVYQQQGLNTHARALYNRTLWQFPLDAELRYSHAIFLSSLNDYQGALDTLQYIPNNARTNDIEQFAQQLSVNAKLDKLENNNPVDRTTIIYNLTELGAQPLTPLMQAELAVQWQQINELQYATRQLKIALERDSTLSPYWHMTYGQWLLDSGNDQQVKHWFANYQLPQQATTDEQARWLSLQVAHINKLNQPQQRLDKLNKLAERSSNSPEVIEAIIATNIELNRPKTAIDLYLQQQQSGNALSSDTQLAVAQISREQGDYALSDNIIASLIENVQPDQLYQQQLLMTALVDLNDDTNAINLAKSLLVKSDYNQEMYYQAAQVAQSKEQPFYAETWYKEAIEPHSSIKATNDPTLNYKLYRLDDEAPWYINNAKRELASMVEKNQAYITAGINFSSQTSTQNQSTLGAGSIPIEAGFPLWDGLAIIKLDPVTIAGQETRFDETFSGSRYGQGALCILDCPLTSIEPKQEGIDIGLAWKNDTWRFDIGTTPIGFLVEDIVWGVDYSNSFGDFGYSVTLNKRPVTSSVLSYGGLEDVFTNQVWGGVRATSLRFNVSHDLGLEWGFWGSTDFQLLQGKNVKDNQQYSIMGGAYNRYIQKKDLELTVGASLLHWSFKHNLSEETYGHGGYYSPQSYIGASIPVTFDHRLSNDFIYRLRAGLSWSTTKNDGNQFFPNDPILQSQAIQRESITGVSPFFEGDKSTGISYSLGGSFEYRFTPHWFFGGFFNLDRADFYEPNFGQLYFRYYFKPVYTEMTFPGTPVVPYASY